MMFPAAAWQSEAIHAAWYTIELGAGKAVPCTEEAPS